MCCTYRRTNHADNGDVGCTMVRLTMMRSAGSASANYWTAQREIAPKSPQHGAVMMMVALAVITIFCIVEGSASTVLFGMIAGSCSVTLPWPKFALSHADKAYAPSVRNHKFVLLLTAILAYVTNACLQVFLVRLL